MARPQQVALVVLVYANGVLLATWRSAPQATPAGALVGGLALVVLVAVAAHLANEAADHETDRLTRRTPFSGGSGALVASGLGPSVPLAAAGTVAAVVLAGAVAAAAGGWLSTTAALVLLLGLAGSLLYSLPPVAAMRRGLGEPLNALLGGLLLPLYGVAVVAGEPSALDVFAFVPFACVALASVLATAWPDRAADAATGKATLQVRLSTPTLRRIHALASVAFVATTVVSAAVGAMPLALAGLAVLPLVWLGAAGYTRRRSPWPNVAAMVGLALISAATLSAAVWT